MNCSLRWCAVFWALLLSASFTKVLSEGSVFLNGICYDRASSKNITARISVVTDGRKVELGNSGMSGFRKIQLPATAQFLIFESEGYRTYRTPVRLVEATPGSSFYVKIPMVAKDTQQQDQVYQQTEQQHYVQDSTSSEAGVKKAIFDVRDALTSNPVAARICLTFTKSAQTKCFDSNLKASKPAILLTQRDIIGFEVTAAGYQAYRGNLIVESLDGKEAVHTIGLLKHLNQLAVQLAGNAPRMNIS